MSQANTIKLGKAAANLANPTSASVFVTKADSTKAVAVPVPWEFAQTTGVGLKMYLYARGRATTGTTSNFLAKFQFSTDVSPGGIVTAATAGNNTDLATLTNRSYATVTRDWYMEATLIWNTVSQRLTGQFDGVNAETIETARAIITALTAVDLTTGKCGFVVAAIFGSSNSSNVAVLDELALEIA